MNESQSNDSIHSSLLSSVKIADESINPGLKQIFIILEHQCEWFLRLMTRVNASRRSSYSPSLDFYVFFTKKILPAFPVSSFRHIFTSHGPALACYSLQWAATRRCRGSIVSLFVLPRDNLRDTTLPSTPLDWHKVTSHTLIFLIEDPSLYIISIQHIGNRIQYH